MRILLLSLIILCTACGASAQTYYADISIDISVSGSAEISGTTNHPLLSLGERDSLTSKKGSSWLFNLTLPQDDVFSDYVCLVTLPEGASVNYVKAESARISTSGDRIVVSGSASNRTLGMLIQYKLKESSETSETPVIYGFLALSLALIALVALFKTLKGKRQKKEDKQAIKPVSEEKKPSAPVPLNYSKYEAVLTDRQKDILAILQEEGKPVNQTLICERLSLPKSSVSRNVASLCNLGLAEKKRIGMSTFISLKE